jgi:hypothetical protein
MATCTKCCLPLAKIDLAQYPATAHGLSPCAIGPGQWTIAAVNFTRHVADTGDAFGVIVSTSLAYIPRGRADN